MLMFVFLQKLGPDLPGFLFQPFRKPKRIRTAFSPTQLLRLEHAFEKNHYVVGTERKQLAKALGLSETQVSKNLPFSCTLFYKNSPGPKQIINLPELLNWFF